MNSKKRKKTGAQAARLHERDSAKKPLFSINLIWFQTPFRRYRDGASERLALRSFFIVFIFLLSFHSNIPAQDLPDKIRGYKVHKAKIAVKTEREKTENSKDKDKNEAFVKINDPEVFDVSLTGITFELEAELSSIEQSGTVDFLTFHDFRVNGLRVSVEEYNESFDFKKNETVILLKSFKIFLGTGQALSGALKEIKDSKKEWRVTGRVFVFGQFKKSFLKFKRVVPIDIDILIKNPLNNYTETDETKEKTDTEN